MEIELEVEFKTELQRDTIQEIELESELWYINIITRSRRFWIQKRN